MTGYEKSSEDGSRRPGRWTIAIWLIAVIAAAVTIWFLR
jgi:hypothetical protein